MKYINEKTGKVIDVESEMTGAWKPVEAPKKKTPAKSKEGAKKK